MVALMDIGPQEILLIALAVLVLFGGSQLPKIARNIGKAQAELKKGLAAGADEVKAKTPAESTPATPTSTAPTETTTETEAEKTSA